MKRNRLILFIATVLIAYNPVVSLVVPAARKATCWTFQLYCSEFETVTFFSGRPKKNFTQREPVEFEISVHAAGDRSSVPLGPEDVGIVDGESRDLRFVSNRTGRFKKPISLYSDGLAPAIYNARAIFAERLPYLSSQSANHTFQVLQVDTFTDFKFSLRYWIVSGSDLTQPTPIGDVFGALEKIPGSHDRWYLNLVSPTHANIADSRYVWFADPVKFPVRIGVRVSQNASSSALVVAIKHYRATLYSEIRFAEDTVAQFWIQTDAGGLRRLDTYRDGAKVPWLIVPSTIGVDHRSASWVEVSTKETEELDGIVVAINLPGRASAVATVRGVPGIPWSDTVQIGLSSDSVESGRVRVLEFNLAHAKE